VTASPNPQRPSKPHLADAIALRRGVQITDLHLHLIAGTATYRVSGEGRDPRGRRVRLGGTVPAGHRTRLDDLAIIVGDGPAEGDRR
jgi:hypothetical protein